MASVSAFLHTYLAVDLHVAEYLPPASEWDVFRFVNLVFFALGVSTLVALFFTTAPYGKYSRSGWGPTMNAKLAWMLMEAPSPLVFALTFLIGDKNTNTLPGLVFATMYLVHYINRSFIFPLTLKSKPYPVSVAALAVLFNIPNGYLNGRMIYHFMSTYSEDYVYSFQFVAGVAVFLFGMRVNWSSDAILRDLKEASKGEGYKIPRGGWFEYVSAANYFGEIVEWTGWAIATGSPSAAVFALWTAFNLGPRAVSHHKWYKRTFRAYPKERKALIPFVL